MKKQAIFIFSLIFFSVFPILFQWILYQKAKRDIRRLAKTKEGRVKLVDKVADQLGFYYKGNVQVLHIIDLEEVKKDPIMEDADEDDLVFMYTTKGIKVLYDTESGKIKFAVRYVE